MTGQHAHTTCRSRAQCLPPISRRTALKILGGGGLAAAVLPLRRVGAQGAEPAGPNVLFVMSDQQQNRTWQMNNRLIQTPRLMGLAAQGTVVQNAVSQTPVCTPYRAMLMSGQYPRTTGVTKNDIKLTANGNRFSEVMQALGYHNGYIGKWHLSAARVRGSQIVLPADRHAFNDTWKGHEALHNYRTGTAWYNETNAAVALTEYRNFQEADAVTAFLDDHVVNHADKPFFAVWSMGPPHNPYNQYDASQPPPGYAEYLALLADPANRPPNYSGTVSLASIAGYYAMCTGIDTALGQVLDRLDALGLAENTIVVYTSDHGDMLGAFNQETKQKPWEESINVPFIVRYPGVVPAGRVTDMLLGCVDLMPTLLGLMGRADAIPAGIEGLDLSAALLGRPGAYEREHLWIGVTELSGTGAAQPPAKFTGVKTKRHTYASFANGVVKAGYGVNGGYVLYDNVDDPWQLDNRVDKIGSKSLQASLYDRLVALNTQVHETFTLPPRPATAGTYMKWQ
jgi:arylsulfatase A-like enzyme